MNKLDTETKLSAACTRLILDKPFLGVLVLRLPMVLADSKWCKTTATDARSLYYNQEFIDRLNLSETQFIIAHEALHCALSHFARRQHRDKHRWDIACDFAINPILIKENLTPPIGTLYEESFAGMTAEEIYPFIKESEPQETLDQHIYDDSNSSSNPSNQSQDLRNQLPHNGNNSSGDPKSDNKKNISAKGAAKPDPLNKDERNTLDLQWKQRLAGAAQQAYQVGKLSSDMARLVDFFIQPNLPWRSLLAHYFSTLSRDDYSYTRPSSRRGDPAIFPSLRSQQIDIVIALDTSGSIDEEEIREFLSEVNALKGQIRARIVLQTCDAKVAPDGPWTYEPWEEFNLPRKFIGKGGTDFQPIFKWAETLDRPPELLLYFTDAEGSFPDKPPEYPVIWLIKGKLPTPWGQRIQLN